MSTQTAPLIVDALKWRYATKKFDESRKIDEKTWKQIEEALLLTPSSFGLQPWRFVIVTDQKIKEQLPPLSWNQHQPTGCSHFILICRQDKMTAEHVKHYVDYIAKTRNVPAESLAPYAQMMNGFIGNASPEFLEQWMAKQCYIALGNLMTVASTLGVDNCPMEGIDHAAYDKLFSLPEKGCRAVVACALGYRAADDKYAQAPKVRFPASDLIIKV